MAQPLAAHTNAASIHRGLFQRIDALHERRKSLGLSDEQRRLLERMHLDHVRAGARVAPADQVRYGRA